MDSLEDAAQVCEPVAQGLGVGQSHVELGRHQLAECGVAVRLDAVHPQFVHQPVRCSRWPAIAQRSTLLVQSRFKITLLFHKNINKRINELMMMMMMITMNSRDPDDVPYH